MDERRLLRAHCNRILAGLLLVAVPTVGQLVEELQGRYDPVADAMDRPADSSASGDGAATDWLPPADPVTLGFVAAGAALIACGALGLRDAWRLSEAPAERPHRPRLEPDEDSPRRTIEEQWCNRATARPDRPYSVV